MKNELKKEQELNNKVSECTTDIDMLRMIKETEESTKELSKFKDLLVTYGDINIIIDNSVLESIMDYMVIPIYKNKGIRLVIERGKMIRTCCENIVSPYLLEPFMYAKNEKIYNIFETILLKAFREKITPIFNNEVVKARTGVLREFMRDESEAQKFAQAFQNTLELETEGNFTRWLFSIIKCELFIEIQKLFFEYIKCLKENKF